MCSSRHPFLPLWPRGCDRRLDPRRPWPLAVESHHAEAARGPLARALGKLPASKLVDHALSLAANLTRNFTEAAVGETLVLALKPSCRGTDAVRVCDDFWPFISAQVETDRNDFARSVLVIRVNAKWARAHRQGYLNSSMCLENATMRFTLTKAGWDTMGVLDRLADAIKCNRRCFTVAGLKDKSGVTEQHVTAALSPRVSTLHMTCPPLGEANSGGEISACFDYSQHTRNQSKETRRYRHGPWQGHGASDVLVSD